MVVSFCEQLFREWHQECIYLDQRKNDANHLTAETPQPACSRSCTLTKTTRKTAAKKSQPGHASEQPRQPVGTRPATARDNRRAATKSTVRRFHDDEHAVTELSDSARTGSSVDNTDDPVRMYLMQMGEIPLLKRVEEIDAAKEIEETRSRYRHSMLANDFILQGALHALQQVRDGQLRLDRTIEVSVTNTTAKRDIMRRLGPNVKTLKHLLESNERDFRIAISKRYTRHQRHAAWKRLVRRRNKAVRLVEEMNLRTNRLQPLFDKLHEISDRMQLLRCRSPKPKRSGT